MVQVGTMNYKFPDIANTISHKLGGYLEENNIKSISSLVGSVNNDK